MLTVTNPATGAKIADLETDTPTSIADKVARARSAQSAWAATPLSERIAALARFRDRLHADVEVLARLLSEEVGKPIAQARNEIANTQRLEFFLANSAAVLADEHVFADDGGSERIAWEPLGVVANVSA